MLRTRAGAHIPKVAQSQNFEVKRADMLKMLKDRWCFVVVILASYILGVSGKTLKMLSFSPISWELEFRY